MTTLTDKIKTALAQRDGVSEEAMRPLAMAYASEVGRVNERLSSAVALLHKGLRSEAIQLASLAPNAIDAAAALDFPEFEEWCDILQFLGIRTPQELNRDLADQLGEAIVDEQPLHGLLKQHRRLAIARAPLRWRLKILRRIAEIDSMNGVWEEDIESWEAARLKQLSVEVPSALAKRDAAQLQSIQQELTQSPWRVSPDGSLAKQVAFVLKELNDEAVAGELAKIAPQLYEAFCQFDEPAARAALRQWNAARCRMTTPIAADLVEQTEGAVAWLEEIDREAASRRERNAAIGRLESALDANQDRNRIQAAFNACGLFDEPPPIEIVTRCRLAMERFDLVDKRRNQSMIAAIAALAMLAVGSIVYWQMSAAHERNVVAAESQLAAMISTKTTSDAEGFWARLAAESPKIAGDPRLQSLSAKLDTIVQIEAVRAKQFANYLSVADINDVTQMDFSALAKSEDLASIEDEKAAVFKIRRRYASWEQEIETAQTKAILADVKSTRDRLDEIEKMLADEVPTQELTEIGSKLEETLSRNPRASSIAKSQIASAKSRLNSLRDALRDRRDRISAEKDAMVRVSKSSSWDELVASLESFATEAPGLPVAREFSQVALERSHWSRAHEWNTLASAVAATLENGLAGDTSTKLIDEETVLKTNVGSNIASNESGSWKDRVVRYPERMEILKRVFGELPDTVVADLYTFVESEGEGERYFTYKAYHERNRQKFQSSRVGLEILINDSGAVKVSTLLPGPFKVIDEPYSTVQWLTGLHQTASSSFAKDWEGEFLKTIGQLRTRPGLDSQVKEMLTQHLLAGACEGSDWLSKQLVKELLVLRARSKEREHWYEPVKLNDALNPEVDAKVIMTVASLYRSRPQIADDIKALRRSQYAWIGVLLRDPSGRIESLITKPPSSDGRLLVVRASLEDSSKTDFVVVGHLANSKPVLDVGTADLIAGRPLFFIPN